MVSQADTQEEEPMEDDEVERLGTQAGTDVSTTALPNFV